MVCLFSLINYASFWELCQQILWLCDANFQKHELKVLPIYHFRMRANPISVSHRKICTYHLPSICFAILQRIEVSYSRLPFKSVCQGCQQKPLLKDGWEKLIRPRETRQTWMAAAYPTKNGPSWVQQMVASMSCLKVDKTKTFGDFLRALKRWKISDQIISKNVSAIPLLITYSNHMLSGSFPNWMFHHFPLKWVENGRKASFWWVSKSFHFQGTETITKYPLKLPCVFFVYFLIPITPTLQGLLRIPTLSHNSLRGPCYPTPLSPVTPCFVDQVYWNTTWTYHKGEKKWKVDWK